MSGHDYDVTHEGCWRGSATRFEIG